MTVTDSESELVRVSVAAGIAVVEINREERRNALSTDTLAQLVAAFATAKSRADVRVVVLRGAGDAAFCAGADLGKLEGSEQEMEHARGALGRLFVDMWELGKPVIARVSGYALAGGFGLALACDIIVASTDAVFGTPEINVGLWPYMISVPLLRALPPKIALELMMTGRRVSADDACQMGFVKQVVRPEDLDACVEALAAELAAKPAEALRLGRDAFYALQDNDTAGALHWLNQQLTIATETEDAREGLAAFAEKRAPNWR